MEGLFQCLYTVVLLGDDLLSVKVSKLFFEHDTEAGSGGLA